MTLFAGGLNSETLFNEKNRDDFICGKYRLIGEYILVDYENIL